MRLLLTGDFGGVLPDEVFAAMRRERFDAVLSMGDHGEVHKLRELFLKYGNEGMMKHVTEEQCIKIYEEGIEKARGVFEKLNSFGKPIYLVSGNNEMKAYELFAQAIGQYTNLRLVDNQKLTLGKFTIIGVRYPAPSPAEQQKGKTHLTMREKMKKQLRHYFNSSDAKKVLLLTHIPPFNCALDKLPKNARLNPGTHIGSKLAAEIVKTYNPALVICGHLEELQGECRFSRSRIINPGGAENGRYAIMEIGKSIKDAKVEFKRVTLTKEKN